MRPLYLDGVPGCRVVLDQPALRVMVPDKADQLFPLSRISRVVCKGCVDWSMSALLACADTGIHLIFLDAMGQVRARWLGRGGTRQALAQRLMDLLARADGLPLYQNWLLSMEKLAVRSLARRMAIINWREVSIKDIRNWLQASLSAEELQGVNLLQSLLYSELLIWLADCGFASDDEALINNDLDLAIDLSVLLTWDVYPSLLNKSDKQALTLLNIAEVFQQHKDRFYLLFRSTISKLQQFLLAVS